MKNALSEISVKASVSSRTRTLRLCAFARIYLKQRSKGAKESPNLDPDLTEIFIGTPSPPSNRPVQSVTCKKRRMGAEFLRRDSLAKLRYRTGRPSVQSGH